MHKSIGEASGTRIPGTLRGRMFLSHGPEAMNPLLIFTVAIATWENRRKPRVSYPLQSPPSGGRHAVMDCLSSAPFGTWKAEWMSKRNIVAHNAEQPITCVRQRIATLAEYGGYYQEWKSARYREC